MLFEIVAPISGLAPEESASRRYATDYTERVRPIAKHRRRDYVFCCAVFLFAGQNSNTAQRCLESMCDCDAQHNTHLSRAGR